MRDKRNVKGQEHVSIDSIILILINCFREEQRIRKFKMGLSFNSYLSYRIAITIVSMHEIVLRRASIVIDV
jgi:hypothetical protein